MAANKPGKAEILAAFFDDGTYSPLFTDGAVSAAYGCANGQNTYVVFEDGSPVGVQDIEKNIRVLEMAAETGAPVVTFYDSTGAKLEGGLDLLNANARLTAEIARVSGVVPQVAVVTGTCAGTNAINAAAADVCVMAEDAELFLNAPFNAEDKVANAGSAAFAAKAGVAAVTAADAVAAAKLTQSFPQTLLRATLCGVLMYLAVTVWRDRSKVVAILFCVPAFILAGFEHSIADFFYFSAAAEFSGQMWLFTLAALLGNSVGAMLLPLLASVGKGRRAA